MSTPSTHHAGGSGFATNNSTPSSPSAAGDIYRADGIVPGAPTSTFIAHTTDTSAAPAATTGPPRPPIPTVFFEEDPICCKWCQARSLVVKAILLGILVVAFVTTIAVVLGSQSKAASVVVTNPNLFPSSTAGVPLSSTGMAGNNSTNNSSSSSSHSSSSSTAGTNYSSTISITEQRVNYTNNPGWKP